MSTSVVDHQCLRYIKPLATTNARKASMARLPFYACGPNHWNYVVSKGDVGAFRGIIVLTLPSHL